MPRTTAGNGKFKRMTTEVVHDFRSDPIFMDIINSLAKNSYHLNLADEHFLPIIVAQRLFDVACPEASHLRGTWCV